MDQKIFSSLDELWGDVLPFSLRLKTSFRILCILCQSLRIVIFSHAKLKNVGTPANDAADCSSAFYSVHWGQHANASCA